MRRGLVVGKFMPLHRGHQLLIETALAQTDELTVVVYDTIVGEPWDSLMPAQKRASWIASLYPGVHNIVVLPDTLEGAHEEHDHPRFAKHYADQLAFLGPFTHVFTSEMYGTAFAKALKAEDVRVDQVRKLVHISGTDLREEMYENRAYLDALVYKSLIQKVVFVGTESTGKSTIAKALAGEYQTNHTQEYGRTLWEEHIAKGVEHSFHDLYDIGMNQYAQEEAARLHSNQYLFCDTNPFTTMLWSEMTYGAVDARLVELVNEIKDDYIWFYCSNDFGWVDDGTRELKGNKSIQFQHFNMEKLLQLEIPVSATLYGNVFQRTQTVKKWLEHQRKESSD